MYLGYQGNKIKFYTQTMLDKVIYTLDRIEETEDEYVFVRDEYVLKTDIKVLNQAKQIKIQENDKARDEALNQGILYKNILFDSDTDQKVNLLAIVSTMSETDTITWFGKDNQPLDCTKEDLINIGSLITELHSFCWNRNAQIKQEINAAQSIEVVEAIEINYNKPEENTQSEGENE